MVLQGIMIRVVLLAGLVVGAMGVAFGQLPSDWTPFTDSLGTTFYFPGTPRTQPTTLNNGQISTRSYAHLVETTWNEAPVAILGQSTLVLKGNEAYVFSEADVAAFFDGYVLNFERSSEVSLNLELSYTENDIIVKSYTGAIDTNGTQLSMNVYLLPTAGRSYTLGLLGPPDFLSAIGPAFFQSASFLKP
jgi:hypothetical protein